MESQFINKDKSNLWSFSIAILPREAINKALIVSHLRDIALDLK